MYHETEGGGGQRGQGGGSGMSHGGEWGYHGYRGWGNCCCGCGRGCHYGGGHYQRGGFGPGFVQRRFIGKEEVIAKLEEYLKQLQAEVRGVEERIAELKKTS